MKTIKSVWSWRRLKTKTVVVTVLNGYFPQGDNIKHETKYPHKRQFYKDLMTYLNDYHNKDEQVIVLGDNISPIDADIGIGEPNAKRWLKTGKCSFQPEEREWLKTLMDWAFDISVYYIQK